MKKMPLFFLAICSCFCSNEFELTADWKDIPVVYGLLSTADEVHYLRVEKAFLDSQTSALEIARIPDSLFYNNITVQLEHVSTGDLFTLDRVNASNLGIPRDEGIFASAPNILYRIAADRIDLIGGDLYRLLINRGEGQEEVVAQTRVIEPYEFVQASPANPIDWQYQRDITVTWRSDDEAAVFYDLKMILHYEEAMATDPDDFVEKELEWVVAKNIVREDPSNPRTTVKVPGIGFYQFLGDQLEASAGILRVFRRIDIVVTAGGKELFDYINIGLANTGITSSQVIPGYTNLSEGFGIFSSRYTLRQNNFTVSATTRDSIRDGVFTKGLNFQ